MVDGVSWLVFSRPGVAAALRWHRAPMWCSRSARARFPRARTRCECGNQFEEFGGEFQRVSLWRGRLWPASQDEGETSLGEAGIQQQATYGYFCVGMDGRFDGHVVCRRAQAEPWGTAWVLTTQRGWGWAPAAAAQQIQPPAFVCGAAHRPSQNYRLKERRETPLPPSTTKEKT
jgi:hypothetical protein